MRGRFAEKMPAIRLRLVGGYWTNSYSTVEGLRAGMWVT